MNLEERESAERLMFLAAALYVVKQEPGHLFFHFFYLYKVDPKRK
jgi:hypothetical protein